jgi:hypothetical protein
MKDGYPTKHDLSSHYQSYVLRLWWDKTNDDVELRIALQDTNTGEWHGLHGLGELLNVLLKLIYER